MADLGLALDPANVKAQAMSGIVNGLNQASRQEITFDDYDVEQSDLYDCDAMRMYQFSDIEVELREN